MVAGISAGGVKPYSRLPKARPSHVEWTSRRPKRIAGIARRLIFRRRNLFSTSVHSRPQMSLRQTKGFSASIHSTGPASPDPVSSKRADTNSASSRSHSSMVVCCSCSKTLNGFPVEERDGKASRKSNGVAIGLKAKGSISQTVTNRTTTPLRGTEGPITFNRVRACSSLGSSLKAANGSGQPGKKFHGSPACEE